MRPKNIRHHVLLKILIFGPNLEQRPRAQTSHSDVICKLNIPDVSDHNLVIFGPI